jgi:elongation factor P
MPKINAGALKAGAVIEHQGGLWTAIKISHVKPGKGGAFAQIELKSLIDGRKLNERWRSEDRVETVDAESETLVFMDTTTYEQLELSGDFVGEDQSRFLSEGLEVRVALHGDRPIAIILPDSVVLDVVEADPMIKNQTASSTYKPARASNGMRIMIPSYMGLGERILVSTATGEYMRRAG